MTTIDRRRFASLRTSLLLSACVLAVPGVAVAQTTVNAPETATRNISGAQTLTVTPTGSIVATTQAVNINGASTGAGVVITNSGTIQGNNTNAGGGTGRGISSSSDFATVPATVVDRTATINNNAGANIIGSNDAIRFAAATATNVFTGTIAVNNSGNIVSNGSFGGNVVQAGQGIENILLGTTLNVNNQAGGLISGSQGILSAAAVTNIVNSGTITGTAAFATQGEAIRTNLVAGTTGSNLTLTNEATGNITGVYGVIATGQTNVIINRGTISGSNAVSASGTQTREGIRINSAATLTNQTNTVTLTAGSTTTGGTADGATQAIAFGGTAAAGTTNTLNIETGATINGTIAGSNQALATDTLNLTGTGSQVLVAATGFEALNVQGGIWGIINTFTTTNGTTIAAAGTLRFDDAGASGGSVVGAIANNGALIYNRTGTLTNAATTGIAGTGSLSVVNTGTLTLSATAANTYSGATTITNGRLRTGQRDNSFSPNSAVTVSGAGILDLNDNTVDANDPAIGTPIARNQTIANIAGDGTVRLGQLNAATLTTGSAGGNTTFSGVFTQTGNLTKVGTGTLTLSGQNTATGLLAVNAGGVALPGQWAGAVTLANGTNLTGAGSVAGVLTVGDAAIAPGNAGIGTLTTGGLVLGAGSVLNYDFGAPGTSDLIQVNGNLTLDGTLNVNNVGGFGEGVYRLINYTGALTDNGLVVGSVPAGANAPFAVQTSVATQINLVYGIPAPTTIQFWDGADFVGNGVINGGSGSWTNNLPNWTNPNGTANTAWGGAFAVFQGTAGLVSVNDAISFTGAQFITDGYVIASGTGALSARVAATNLRVDPGVTATINAAIGGSGGLLKNDAGTLVLGGANTYAGATSIAGGTLAVTGGAAIPVGSTVTIAAGGTLDVRANQTIGDLNGAGAVLLSGGTLTTGGAGGAATFSGVASGAGGLIKAGAGTTTLSGANTYTGTTGVAAGTLDLSGSVAGAVNVASGATLTGAGRAGGIVTIADGAVLTPGGAGAGTFTSGGLVLSGGSTLEFGLGAPGAPAASDRLQVNGNLTLDGTLNVTDLGGFGAGVYRLIDYTGALTNNGLVVGTLPAMVNANRVSVQTGVAAQVNLVYDNTVPEIQFWDGANTTANGVVDGGTGSWNNVTNNWTDANGANNREWGGRFAVFQGTAGTVTVNDAITFTGMQFVTTGYTVAGGTGTLTTNTAQTNVRVDPGVAATISAAIGGTGGLNKLDTGTLILSGANTYTGTTTVAGGTLRASGAGSLPTNTAVTVATGATLDVAAAQTIGSLTGTGAVTLSGGTLTAGGANTSTTFGGVASGANGLTKAGTGTFTLTGANTYTGATTVNAGTLALGAGGSIAASSGVTLAAAGRFDISATAATVNGLSGVAGSTVVLGANQLIVNNAAANSFAGVVSGTGSLLKAGAGTLTLSGANAHTGGTSVTGGILAAGATNVFGPGALTVTAPGSATLGTFAQTVASLAGDGAVNLGSATLTVNGTTATTYGGVMSGTGGLTRAGTGTLTLTGASTYTGTTSITGGSLVVNGSLAGPVTLGAAGRLLGTGRIGALTIGGTVAPGNSIGTLNVAGGVTFSNGSTYQVEVAPNGTSDLIAATGGITLLGGTVSVLTGGQTGFGALTTYTILTGTSVAGQFASTTSDFAFLTPSLIYNATNVQLRLLRNDINLAAIATTPNQIAVATAVAARNSGPLFDAVVVLNAATARDAFDQLSGEVHAAAADLTGRDGHAANRALLDRIDTATGDGPQLWAEGALGTTNSEARAGFAKVEADRTAFAGGFEYAGGGTRGGIAYRYADTDIALDARGSDAQLKSHSAMAYVSHDTGTLRFAFGAGAAWQDVTTGRRLAFGGFTNALSAKEDGMSFLYFGELAYLPKFGSFRVGPYAGFSVSSTTLDGVTETGGAAALTVDKYKQTTTQAGYGLRAAGTLGNLRLTSDIGGRSYLNDPDRSRIYSFVGTGDEFIANAAGFGRTAITGRLDASIEAGPAVLGIGIRGEKAKHTESYGVRVSAGIRF